MLANPYKALDRKITIKLYKPHTGQRRIHRSRSRFRIVCCGRRWGKTFMACNEIIDFASNHPGTLSAWVSPSYRQSKIAYRLIRRALHKITEHNDTELRIEFPNGSVIMFASAENYDALRGNGIHFLVMDECADIREKAWLEVLRPCLSDTRGKALLIGTPKGRNFFFTLFCRGQDPTYPDWQSFTAPTSDNPYVPASEIEDARRELPEDTYSQEYLAVFLEESAGVFRNIMACIQGLLDEDYKPLDGHMYTLGWDSAKHQDYSVLTVMDATLMEVVAWERFNQIDYPFQVAQVARLAQKFGAYILMDMTGAGSPLLDYLKLEEDLAVEGFLFTNASKNALVEELQLAFQYRSFTMPEIEIILNELRLFEYKITPSRNMTYSAPPGAHDDCVMSLALAYHAAAKPNVPLHGDTVDRTEVKIPTIAELAREDPFKWADQHMNSWGDE